MHEARWSPCCNSLSRILRRLKGKRRGTRGLELRKLIQVDNCRFKKWENNLAPFPTCSDFLARSWPPSDSRFNPQSAQAKFLSLMVWNARIPQLEPPINQHLSMSISWQCIQTVSSVSKHSPIWMGCIISSSDEFRSMTRELSGHGGRSHRSWPDISEKLRSLDLKSNRQTAKLSMTHRAFALMVAYGSNSNLFGGYWGSF